MLWPKNATIPAMADLQEQLETLTRRLESLEQQNADLREQLADEPAPKRSFDRRGLLRLGGAAAAIGAGSVLLRPGVAGATTGAMQFGADNAAAADSTGLDSSNTTNTLHVTNTATGAGSNGAVALLGHMTDPSNQGTAIHGINDGFADAIVGEVTSGSVSANGSGVVGYGIDFGGVIGVTSGAGPGVGGISFGTGPGVSGATSSGVDGVEAWSDDGATGRALFAHVDNPANARQAAYALTLGTGNAVLGSISHSTSTATAVKGTTNGRGAGVEGASHAGFGGRFSGAVQVLLVPSSASSHPAGGARGALFVDRYGRLWFCKGGTSWKQLA
jgi:hypothetical protein